MTAISNSTHLRESQIHSRMKRSLLWLIVVAALVAGWLLYRFKSGSDLNVTPDAAQEIEKAKRR